MPVSIKRAYEKPSKEDGIRILVDRMWPRGIAKEDLKVHYWMKEVAPSTELRKWFNHDQEKFEEFKSRYKQELKDEKEPLEELKDIMKKEHKHVTLVYGAKDKKHNQAIILKEILDCQRV